MNIWKCVIRLSLLALVGGSFLIPADAAEKPSIRAGKNPAIEVVRINPSKGDLRRVSLKRKQRGVDQTREAQVHVVKIYVEMPPAQAQGYSLYIGDERVQEAGSFPEGIFVKIYEPEDLDAWLGKPVRFVLRDDVVNLGIVIPGRPVQKPARLPDLDEALTPK